MLTIVYDTILDKIMSKAICSDDKEMCANSAIEGLRIIVNYLGDKLFLCGDKPTLADFQFFEGIEYTNLICADDHDGAYRTYQEFPTLEDYRNRIAEQTLSLSFHVPVLTFFFYFIQGIQSAKTVAFVDTCLLLL